MIRFKYKSMEGTSRIFVGGLPVRVEKSGIVDFFQQFGEIRHCKIKKNSKTGRSLGYAYITFENAESANKLLNTQIEFCGRVCECKPVFNKHELREKMSCEKKKKLLVYQLSPVTTNNDLKELFEKFASISHAFVVKDPDSQLSLGYGYVIFHSESDLEEFCSRKLSLKLLGQMIEYTNQAHVPPKKKSRENKDPGLSAMNSEKDGNHLQSLSIGSYKNARKEDLTKIHCSAKFEKRDESQCQIEGAKKIEPQKGTKEVVASSASKCEPYVSLMSGSKSFPAPSYLLSAAHFDGYNIFNKKAADDRMDHIGRKETFNSIQQESQITGKGKMGVSDSTRESGVVEHLAPKLFRKKESKIKQSIILREILRASLYLCENHDNYRLNRESRGVHL